MNNDEFQLPDSDVRDKLIESMSHVRKQIHLGDEAQSHQTDQFILNRAKSMVSERLPGLDQDDVSLVMRCLYQNTPDKEFIIGFHPQDKAVIKTYPILINTLLSAFGCKNFGGKGFDSKFKMLTIFLLYLYDGGGINQL